MIKRVFLVHILLIIFWANSNGQGKTDSLQITLARAEEIFLQNNLQLLAQKYNIDAAKALIIQARLWPNPNLSISQGAYNTVTGKWFETGRETGETSIQLQQLILLAGKINKQVRLAQTNAGLSEYLFYDLMRTLKFSLRSDFFSIYYLQETAKVYHEEIASLQKVAVAFEQQRDKGYIARTEVVRIKAQLYSLENELNDLINQINDKESELRTVLQIAPGMVVVPQVDVEKMENANPVEVAYQRLMDSAYQNRTDLLIAKNNFLFSQQNFSYQKALAVPDVTVGVTYDKNGSYIHNFNSVGVGFNIPIFNRNQGNIKSAKFQVSSNEIQVQHIQKTINEQVARSLQKAIDADRLYQSIDKAFSKEFSDLAKAVFDNYSKRNIGLLDFLTFYDSYKQNIVQLNYISANRINALENINFLTGTNFFNK